MNQPVPDGSISVETLARLLNLSQRRVYALAEMGVIPRSGSGRGAYLLVPAVQSYCRHMQQLVNGGAGNAGLAVERTRLARAQSERIEMENSEKRRQLAPMGVIVEAISRSAAHACDVLDGVPAAVKRRVPDVDPRVMRIIAEEIFFARTIAAGAKMPDSFGEPPPSKPDRKALAGSARPGRRAGLNPGPTDGDRRLDGAMDVPGSSDAPGAGKRAAAL